MVKLNKSKYKGKVISDKQWELLKKISYPNTRHILSKLPKQSWFRKQKSKNRNEDGTFKIGNTPWNKNFKIKFFKKNEKGNFIKPRDSNGRFTKGYKSVLIGAKYEPTKRISKEQKL